MYIDFNDQDLEACANSDRVCVRKMGAARAKKYGMRLTALRGAVALSDLRNAPGKFHELTNNRKGQWACDLDQPYRLIFRPQEDPIPENEDGQYIWEEIKGVVVLEIINYHRER